MTQIWNTVRIFISSTFRDMHAERDYLVKVVFPELRERCAKRKLHLIDIDLRWGITEEEAEQGKVLELILDEVEKSRPFFIGILGERYGSIPDNIPDDTVFAHPWLENYPEHSFTALEIVHGVLNNPELATRSFFYFRDPQFISKVPEDLRDDFIAENSESANKLANLKDEIRSSEISVIENYPCRWDDSKESLVHLEIFGRQVLENLWIAISEDYPKNAPKSDPLIIERQMHEAFAEEQSHLYIGRVEETKLLTEHVNSTDKQPVVITGESGSGKSAFLATWYKQYVEKHPDDYVLAYFIGASPDSTNHMRLLRIMCQELASHFNLEDKLSKDDTKLSETFMSLLLVVSKDRRIVILLDAFDQLSNKEGSHGLGWLLNYLPTSVSLVVSNLEGNSLDVLRRHNAKEIPLQQLTIDEQRQIVHAQLNEWGRKLNEQQISTLLAHPGVKNPLYLRVALEELRQFGSYEQLTERIEILAPDVSSLFNQILERLEDDHGREFVKEAFSLLGCSRYGLSENELLELLHRKGEEQLPPVLWTRLYRSIKAYMVQRGELVSFFHRHFADAVTARYLVNENRHAKLASYFEQSPLERKLDEYPYQLQNAEEWESLAELLSDLDYFEYALDKGYKYKWIGYWRSLKGHFEPGTCYQKAIMKMQKHIGETLIVSNVWNNIGSFLDDMSLYSDALYFKEHALKINIKKFNPQSANYARLISDLGMIYWGQGKYEDAEALHKQALKIREKTLGPEHTNVATSLANLALVYHSQGKYTEAEALLKRALKIYEKSLGPEHTNVATSLANLALVYHSQGKYTEAEPLLKRALKIYEKSLGPEHPYVAGSLNTLAELYDSQGKYTEAEPLSKKALKICEKSLGPEHPHVATSLNNLALVYHSQGKYTEAEPLYKKALQIREKSLGPEHPYVATSLNNLALVYSSQGKYTEAEPLFKQAMEINEKTLGPDHPDVAQSLNTLAELYDSQGKYTKAEPLYKKALKIYEKSLGLEHPYVAQSLNNLAALYYSQGKYEDAEPLFKQAMEINEKTLGPDHPDVAQSLNNLAALYYSQGKYEDAEPLFKQAMEINEKTFGPDHPDVAQSLNNLARFYDSQEKYTEAEPLYKKALQIRG